MPFSPFSIQKLAPIRHTGIGLLFLFAALGQLLSGRRSEVATSQDAKSQAVSAQAKTARAPPGSEMRSPLGITIVGGLIVSQLLTLYTTR